MALRKTRISALATLLAATTASGTLMAEELRLITWGGYAPDEVVAQFEEETGIDVKITLSDNEDMISKLRATGGAGFELAQPSQGRSVGVQRQVNSYKPIDYSRLNIDQLATSMVNATSVAPALNGPTYGVPSA